MAPREPGSAVVTTYASTFHRDHLDRSVRETRSLSEVLDMRLGDLG
ncbi:hypothetical protein [Yinghuangia soli]|uniref:Uncharacterized protein n=1 Tax=Yinghuangia soli TaxID=2908204 RepID=A0AA41TZA5_9ACTN|nr:hypothetical protein [Yinghuangia soli]MCF2527070.1 hypothetical protein [Yinghuangia soli]